jgi:internalin A
MSRIPWIILLAVALSDTGFGQTILPDTNFRNALIKSNPALFNKKLELIDSLAMKYTGAIDCTLKNISNLSGLEKFPLITSFICANNKITSIDQVKNLTKLTYLDCYLNQIAVMPDLSKLTSLGYFKCSGNQLKILPDLSKNVGLYHLDCFDNQITRIPGLEKLVNLINIFAFNNQIDSLSDMSKLTKLSVFQCHKNRLAKLPGLSSLVSLTSLVAGDNPLKELPDLSKLTKLATLMCYSCQLDVPPVTTSMTVLTLLDLNGNNLKAFPDVGKNVNLRELRCQDNQIDSLRGLKNLTMLTKLNVLNNVIRDVSNIIGAQATLTDLVVRNNRLKNLPNLANFKNLVNVQVENNLLTFSDLISILTLPKVTTFTYAPQAQIPIPATAVGALNNPFKITLGIDKGIQGNEYTWVKNGTILSKGPVDTLYIASLSQGDTGSYACSVVNPLFPALTLATNNLQLSVSCMSASNIEYATEDINCEKGGSVVIDESSITGGTPPFVYTLQSTLLGKFVKAEGNKFSGLNEKSYVLLILDKYGCTASASIALKGKSIGDCKNVVIISNGGQGSDLLLEEPGIARVFDKSGHLVHSFKTPATWDGTLSDGSILPGQYFIEHNGESFNVTILK